MSMPTGIAEDVVERLRDRDVDAAFPERHHHLDLEMDVVRRRWVGEDAGDVEVVRVLLEEERRVRVRVAAHLDRVGGVVPADAIDPVHREEQPGAGNRQGW